jgi:NADH:ubiquinone oxidoreductase subunit E
MHNKALVIRLIQQDLKHSQLTEQLRHMGLDDGGLYTLDLMTLVAELLEVPPNKMDQFATIYGKYLDQAMEYPVTHMGEELLPLAEGCYLELLRCWD